MKNLFTSECVTNGHPDKVADQISDGILDECLKRDKKAHVACETMVTTQLVTICGEINLINPPTKEEVETIVRNIVKRIGYDKPGIGFDYRNIKVVNLLHAQSNDINSGVSKREDERTGAGDQGLMFGYATNETDAYMPKPMYYARNLSNKLIEVRKEGILDYLLPDGKTQVTYDYENEKIDTVVISSMHLDTVSLEQLRKDIKKYVIDPIIGKAAPKILINPCGKFVTGGPDGDTGLTGRKIIVDTYGGIARHGGGAFSGKDPSKVDRSAAYMMRYIAKNLVAAGACNQCEIQVAYAIGDPDPVSILVNSFGTVKNGKTDEDLAKIIDSVFKLSPDDIFAALDLFSQKYEPTACYGHFGNFDYTWERTDKVDSIKALIFHSEL